LALPAVDRVMVAGIRACAAPPTALKFEPGFHTGILTMHGSNGVLAPPPCREGSRGKRVFQRDWSTPFCAVTRPRPSRDTARAMSDRDQEIIASLRRTYEAFSCGDFDAAMEMAHPRLS
jgi:hypothetical protein